MDTLVSLFPMLASKDLSALFLSITFAAVVFFYFIHLLRKEETCANAEADKAALDVRPAVRREA